MKTIELSPFQAKAIAVSLVAMSRQIDNGLPKALTIIPALDLKIIIKSVQIPNTPNKTMTMTKIGKFEKTESRQKTTKVSENEAKVQNPNPKQSPQELKKAKQAFTKLFPEARILKQAYNQ